MDEIHKCRLRQPLENHKEGRNERLVRRLTTQKQAVLLEITPHFFFFLKSLFPSQLLLVLLPPFFFFLVFQSFVICTKGSVSLEMCLLIGLSELQLIFLLMWTLVLNLQRFFIIKYISGIIAIQCHFLYIYFSKGVTEKLHLLVSSLEPVNHSNSWPQPRILCSTHHQ